MCIYTQRSFFTSPKKEALSIFPATHGPLGLFLLLTETQTATRNISFSFHFTANARYGAPEPCPAWSTQAGRGLWTTRVWTLRAPVQAQSCQAGVQNEGADPLPIFQEKLEFSFSVKSSVDVKHWTFIFFGRGEAITLKGAEENPSSGPAGLRPPAWPHS